jgi:predicted DNA-binding transcriptional regulator YafY
MTKMFLRCIHERAEIEMIYLSKKGEITQRLITPYWYDGKKVKAFCSVRKQIRTFEIDNILSVKYKYLPS